MNNHEIKYRGENFPDNISNFGLITILGAGSLGSMVADNLARQGVINLRVVDFDRIEGENIHSSAVYCTFDVGHLKVAKIKEAVLAVTEQEIETSHRKLEERSIKKLLKGSTLVVDCLDNNEARKLVTNYVRDNEIACLHVGVADGYAECVWNDDYIVPHDSADDLDPCDVPLARNNAHIITGIACEHIVSLIQGVYKDSVAFTLGDLKISKYR